MNLADTKDTCKRTVRRLHGNSWINCAFADLKPGDIFQLLENKVLYQTHGGRNAFVCESFPEENDGILTVICRVAGISTT